MKFKEIIDGLLEGKAYKRKNEPRDIDVFYAFSTNDGKPYCFGGLQMFVIDKGFDYYGTVTFNAKMPCLDYESVVADDWEEADLNKMVEDAKAKFWPGKKQ